MEGAATTLPQAQPSSGECHVGEHFIALGQGNLRLPLHHTKVISSHNGYSKQPTSDVQCPAQLFKTVGGGAEEDFGYSVGSAGGVLRQREWRRDEAASSGDIELAEDTCTGRLERHDHRKLGAPISELELELYSDSCGGNIARNLIVDYGSGKIALTAACIHFCVPGTALNLSFRRCHSGPINTCSAAADDRGRSRFHHCH
ncbi:hypothetical protein [Oryza sativa Japonica Group]|uniref:Uncharacterized protein n=1 Tax=Oryza sativa subsp. japonica TaxID=39947 RepID=Q8RZ10_ORYSJ|nr:hypothetical protein [Oryza sativa Japonica Group]